MALEGVTEHGHYVHVAANGNGDNVAPGGGPCNLAAIVINTKGATANTLTIYDSLTHGTGTTVAVIDTTAAVGALPYRADLEVGCSYSLATGTAADVTLVFGE